MDREIMRPLLFLLSGIILLILNIPTFAEPGTYPLEDFENPIDSRFSVTTERGCNLTLTSKYFVVSGNHAGMFSVSSSLYNPYRPASFILNVATTDWSQYHSISFYLMVLPSENYPHANLIIQLQSIDYDGTTWRFPNMTRTYPLSVPVGQPVQIKLALKNVLFKEKINKILFGVIDGAGTYYIDNIERNIDFIKPDTLIQPITIPSLNAIKIPAYCSIYLTQPTGNQEQSFYTRNVWYYDSRLPVSIILDYSQPVKRKVTKRIIVSDSAQNKILQTTVYFIPGEKNKSIPISLKGSISIKIRMGNQTTQYTLIDLAEYEQKNLAIQAKRKQSGDPFQRGIISAYGRMIYNPDITLNLDSMLNLLKDLGVNCYTYLIMQKSEAELAALPQFCEKAAKEGIEVWAYLVPPSEVPIGRKEPLANRKYPPFDLDYIKWAEAIAKISLQHPNLTLWMIDDFDGNMKYFTLAYTRKMYQASKQINPNLKVGYCVYHDGDRLNRFVDGGYLPYCDGLLWGYQHNFWGEPHAGISAQNLPIEINDYYKICGDKLIIPCIYIYRHSSWPQDRPTLKYLEEAMNIAYQQAGIVWLFTTPQPGTENFTLVQKYIQTHKLIKWKQK
jgi:hypothetical protein